MLAQLPAAKSQGQLKDEEFLVEETSLGGLGSIEGQRAMDIAKSGRRVRKMMSRTHRLGENIGYRIGELVDRTSNDRTQIIGAEIFRERIVRHDARRFTLNIGRKDLDLRIAHLPAVLEALWFSGKGEPLTVVKEFGN